MSLFAEVAARGLSNFVSGEWRRGNGTVEPTPNPATAEVLANLAFSDVRDIDAAVSACARRTLAWRSGGHDA